MLDINKAYGKFGRYSADLCLFLLVARHGQLSAAAVAAGISQPRVSQRMQSLEEGLGCRLFIRERRGITLTPEGQELNSLLAEPLNTAVDAFDRFQRTPRQDGVVILSDIAFAGFLLLPEFAALSEAFADLSISLMTVQIPDPRHYPNADMIIRMEPRHDVAAHETRLFDEFVSAVCSPAFKAAHPQMQTPADLRDRVLIDLSTRTDAPWYTWAEWLGEQGVSLDARHERVAFTSYDHVISAARSGIGVALGWEGLIDIDTPGSGLVRAIPARLQSDRGYYLRILPGRANRKSQQVLEWLAGRFTRMPLPSG